MSQINSPELLNKLAELRAKTAAGTITLDEMREAIKLLRGSRVSAQDAAKASKTKSTKSGPVDAAGLLNELSGL